MVQVKICGITRMVDAERAVQWGADALGFVFAKSPREVTPEKARDIIQKVSPFAKTVGVFVDEPSEKILEIMDFCGLDLAQLHGKESVSQCREMGPRVIKAFRVQGEGTLKNMARYRGHVKAVLLDSFQKGLNGGTGRTFDWDLAVKAKKTGIPVVLSGGLGPENIQEALLRVTPFAIDVSSGIEKRPGIKDHERMGMFMESVTDFQTDGKPMGRYT